MDDKYFDSQAKTKEELGRALRVRTECFDYMKHFWEYCQLVDIIVNTASYYGAVCVETEKKNPESHSFQRK